MTKRKKLLIALLSASCLTAGAFGLAACKDDDKPEPTPPPEDKGYSVVAIDDKNNPVEGVWLCVGYYDSATYSTVYVQKDGKDLLVKTDAQGKAVFNFEPEAGKLYSAYLADADKVDGGRAYPYGYNPKNASVTLKEDSSVNYVLDYVPSHFNYNYKTELNYKRVYDTQSETVKENKSDTTLTLKSGIHSYFYLRTYESPKTNDGDSDEKVAEVIKKAQKAAAGVYEVSITSTSSASIKMYYAANTNYFTDKSGIPPHETADEKTDKITLELTVADGQATAPQYFGIYADADCEVTVKVTRTGDAVEPEDIQKTPVAFTAPTEKFVGGSGTLTSVPIPNKYDMVKGDDGYYHVGTKTGPLLLVNLTKVDKERIGELSLKDIPSYKDAHTDNSEAYVFANYENGKLKSRADYTDMIAEYSKWVNSDGVYPVNDDLYGFLHRYQGYISTNPQYMSDIWLIPCKFYSDDGGITATGTGTQADPFVLAEAKNKLSNTGATAYLSFTANADGAYMFEADSGVLQADNASVIDGKTYIALKNGQTATLTLSAASANTSVTVTGGNEAIQGVFGNGTPILDNDGNKIGEDWGQGTKADTAIAVNVVGITPYIVDKNACEEGVWVKFGPMSEGVFTFAALGTGAQIVYNGDIYDSDKPLSVTCSRNNPCIMLLTAKDGENVKEGIYILNIYVDNKLTVGDKTVTVQEAYMSYEYIFTADESGWYEINSSQIINISDDNYNDIVALDTNGKFYYDAESGGMTLWLSLQDSSNLSVDLTIAPTEAPATSQITVGSSSDITIPAGMDGYECDVELEQGETYVMQIGGGPLIYQSSFTVYISNGMGPAQQFPVSANNSFMLEYTPDIDPKFEGAYKIAIVSNSMDNTEVTVTLGKKLGTMTAITIPTGTDGYNTVVSLAENTTYEFSLDPGRAGSSATFTVVIGNEVLTLSANNNFTAEFTNESAYDAAVKITCDAGWDIEGASVTFGEKAA